jgi:hypothetical protein
MYGNLYFIAILGLKVPSLYFPFLQDFVDEITRLNPSMKGQKRSCTVVMKRLVADAVGRQHLKGVTTHSGYWACERCKQK